MDEILLCETSASHRYGSKFAWNEYTPNGYQKEPRLICPWELCFCWHKCSLVRVRLPFLRHQSTLISCSRVQDDYQFLLIQGCILCRVMIFEILLFNNSSAIFLQFRSTFHWYSLKSGCKDSPKATAIADIVWKWGPPCRPGNTAPSILALSSYRISLPVFTSYFCTPTL